MGSDAIALPALNAIARGECGDVDILAVYTQPDKPRGRGKRIEANAIKLWALENEIPVFQPGRVDRAVRMEIEAMNPDVILIMAYGHLLSQALIDVPLRGTWNLHTSILPKYRGASPIQASIVSGGAESGVSFMRLVRQMDAGPVLDVEKVDIERLDTAMELESKLSQACVPLLARCLPSVLDGSAKPESQNESDATYVRKLSKSDGTLDFNQPAAQVANRINGLFPWPGTRFEHDGVVLKVGLADYDDQVSGKSAGFVLGLEPQGLAVACETGTLFLKRLQRPGGKMLDAESFLRGFEIPEGTILKSKDASPLVASQPF